ncbi:MAG: NAD-dependent epimerase/dehydratase family protein [Planctomycetaceae bacterium]
MQRIAITGSSGYYGSKLVEHIRRESPETRILGLDVVPPREAAPHEFVQADVRSSDVRTTLANFQPDTIVHLAFVLNPIRDTRLMHDVNVGGTKNVFEAVRAIRPQRFLVASSATAYGAWPDNPVPIAEDWPLRACTEFQYASDKTTVEAAVQTLADELPEVAVSWTRPVIIGGKGVSNYLSRFVLNLPFLVLPNGNDVPLHFVHEDDCVAATWAILKGNARGPFNVGPPDYLPLTTIAKLTNRRAVKLPFWMMKLTTTIWWGLRLPIFDFPPSLHYLARYPWVVTPARLQNELGFQFRYSSADTLLEMWGEHCRKKRR